MNSNIKKEKGFLQYLANANRKQEKLIMKIITKSQMEAICAIVYNALYGTFSLRPSLVDNLRAYREQLHRIVDKKIAKATRKDLLVRRAHEVADLLRVVLKEIYQNVG